MNLITHKSEYTYNRKLKNMLSVTPEIKTIKTKEAFIGHIDFCITHQKRVRNVCIIKFSKR